MVAFSEPSQTLVPVVVPVGPEGSRDSGRQSRCAASEARGHGSVCVNVRIGEVEADKQKRLSDKVALQTLREGGPV